MGDTTALTMAEAAAAGGGGGAAPPFIRPTVFPPSVLIEKIAPRTTINDGANVYAYWFPRLEVGVRSARLHTRWIIPKEDIERPIGFKFPLLDQTTWKLGRV